MTIDALRRAEASRIAARGALRHHFLMTMLGFIGGMFVVVPATYWLAGAPQPWSRLAAGNGSSAIRSSAASLPGSPRKAPDGPTGQPGEAAGSSVQLASKPALTRGHDGRTGPADSQAALNSGGASGTIEVARAYIRSGNIVDARKHLSDPSLAGSGEAVFMLAETFDPNVLAALGVAGVQAEPAMARRLYETASGLGMTAAWRRLEALR